MHALVILTLYQMLRLLFWWQNRLQFPDLVWDDATRFAWYGLRFDLAALAMSNGLSYVVILIPWPRAYRFAVAWFAVGLATCANALAVGLNLVDVEYYKFTGKRLTLDSFAIAHDIGQQFGQIARYYWLNSLLLLLLWFLVAWISARLLFPFESKYREATRRHKVGQWAWTLITIAAIALAMRGGWQAKPLIPAQAFADIGGRAGVISLNSTFTVLKSSSKVSLSEDHFFSAAELKSLLPPQGAGDPVLTKDGRKPKNVVLVILESFGQEYVQPGPGKVSYAPFLAGLMQKGSSYPEAFANGRRSIDALPSILASVPAWMEPPFITSPYQTNQVIGLASQLKSAGYQSTFYHGGRNGTMFFDLMAQQFGFDHYKGANEYPLSGDDDGQWGIFDEPFLQFVAKDLTAQNEPFFATIFTLSSHHPYRIPDAYQGRFPKGTLEIHESIGYADYALQKFYETARQQKWFADTLFIFTADHTSKSEDPLYETSYGRYAVPLLFIQNDQALTFPQPNEPAQHADIMPTVLDLLGIPAPQHTPFGQSLARPLSRPGVVLYEGETYHLFSRDQVLSWSREGSAKMFRWPLDPLLTQALTPLPSAADAQLRYLKAQIQAYNNGMVQNHLIW